MFRFQPILMVLADPDRMHRVRCFFLLLLALIGFGAASPAQSYGSFRGAIQVEWLDDDPDGRKMRLLAPFTYIDPSGLEWDAPVGSIIDGASIPQFFWSIIGGPYEGRYRKASVIHDVACVRKNRPWELVHRAFYYAMLADGVNSVRAKIMYGAVYHFGPRWPLFIQRRRISKTEAEEMERHLLGLTGSGSTAEIRVVPQNRSSEEIFSNQPAKVDLEAVFRPQDKTLSETDFVALRTMIEQGEAASPNGVTLQDIERFTTPK